ncbi:MAG: hypothetical protein J2P21_26515 [Chloracidobacterium sp.]|nr:hypothetical protein [Chloracidobacterium sp.]
MAVDNGAGCCMSLGSWWRGDFHPADRGSACELFDRHANWPAIGQAAVGIVNSSSLETHGAQTPAPTANAAKLITALIALNARPLRLRQSGPMITMSSNDIE